MAAKSAKIYLGNSGLKQESANSGITPLRARRFRSSVSIRQLQLGITELT